MGNDMKESGKKGNFMEKVSRLYLMELFLMESGSKEGLMVKACVSIQMEPNTPEVG